MTVLFETVLRMSMTASVVILAVLLLRLPLRKAPKKISYALWSAVGFRLLCPVSFRSVFSLFRFMPGQVSGFFSGTPAETELSAPLVSAVQAELSAAPVLLQSAETAAGSLPLPDASAFSLPMQTFESTFTSSPLVPAAEEAVRNAAPSVESAVPVPVDHAALFLRIGAAVWLAGMAVLLLYALVSAILLKRRLRTATRLSEGVYRSEAVRSPFLLGFFRPKIYVPYGLEPDTLSYVICHERYHLRRRDDLWKAVGFLALALHWFNPAVWIAFRLMTRDMEMSCDEHVLSENRQITRAYSMSLLSFAANRRFPAPSPLAFGETDVKKRIRNVLDWKKPKIRVTVLSALLCAAAIVACAADPKEPSADALPEAEEAAETVGAAAEESEPASADGSFRTASVSAGLRPSAEVREHARKSAETIAEMIDALNREPLSMDERPAEYVLLRRLLELGTLYQNLGGGDGSREYTASSTSRLYRAGDAEWMEWIFGRTNILRFELPALWSNLLVLNRDFEENGTIQLSVLGPTYYTDDLNNGNGGKTDRAALFTLILVPAENTDDRTAPDGDGWNRLATVDTKLNGMFQLWFRTDDKPSSEETAAEDERMRLEIPCILSTLEAPRSNVTILDANPDFLSPDEETLARFAAIRQENDAEALRKLDAWLADLTEAFRILRSSDNAGVHSVKDPEISALLRPNGYGISTYWIHFSTPEGEDTAPDEAVLPGDSLPEEAPPENSLAVSDDPAASFRQKEEEFDRLQDVLTEEFIVLVEQEIENRRREEEEQARLAQARLEEQRRTEEEMSLIEEEMRRLFEAELEKKHLTEEQAAEAAMSDWWTYAEGSWWNDPG